MNTQERQELKSKLKKMIYQTKKETGKRPKNEEIIEARKAIYKTLEKTENFKPKEEILSIKEILNGRT